MTDIEELIEKKTEEAEADEDFMKAAAVAYARYLRDHGLVPGDVSVSEYEPETSKAEKAESEPEQPGSDNTNRTEEEEAAEDTASNEEASELTSREVPEESEVPEKKEKTEETGRTKKFQKDRQKLINEFLAFKDKKDPFAAGISLHDRIQDKTDSITSGLGKDIVRGAHNIASTYQHTRRTMGVGILIVGFLAAIVLVIFDRYTVYEYAYNGKLLGYVREQEDVTDVLDVAGRQLTKNTDTGAKVEFVANQNVTFDLVVGRGKSTDDADSVVNKLIYMTDIETEAYGVYDGPQLKAVVKDEEAAERLLEETKAELSIPDSGMKLLSSEFINPLEIRPLNVLLGSVQSNAAARKQMIEGGEMQVYHIVDSEDIASPDIEETDPEDVAQSKMIAALAESFGADIESIYDEDNKNLITSVEPGDIVCIRSIVDPVDVEMVERGRIKEVIEYKTIKKDSDEYYQGDTYIEQEGSNGSRIFEGTITKVAGEETDRQTISEEITKEPKDKIILIGTKERPKTAPTGTFQMPIKSYTVTSEYGGRWGRMHDGIDLGSATGTMIYAADGGTVIRASYYGGYGNCVEIDHENGLVTRYAHCSRLLVNVGDKVYQGQEIALVGNTGHSFGSHLHFEVRVNGASQNPRKYVNP